MNIFICPITNRCQRVAPTAKAVDHWSPKSRNRSQDAVSPSLINPFPVLFMDHAVSCNRLISEFASLAIDVTRRRPMLRGCRCDTGADRCEKQPYPTLRQP